MRKGLLFHDVEQHTPEWWALRLGKVTGSVSAPLLVNARKPTEKNRGLGIGCWSLIDTLAGQLLAGEDETPDFDTFWTIRGKDLEPVAIRAYEDYTFYSAHKVGFVEYENRLAGCSPDFMVDGTRGGEVKCLALKNHIAFARTGLLDPQYLAQVQWCLFVTGFDCWDVVHFHPKGGKKSLIVKTIKRDEELIERFRERFDVVETLITETVQFMRNA